MTTVRGVEIAVADKGAGQPFLWGHGFAASRAADEQSPILDWSRLAREHRVIRWDARGHGGSGGEPDAADYAWANLGKDLVALADALDIERFVAGGVSMGAAVALHAAADAPDRVVGLVLVLPPTAYETRAAQRDEYLDAATRVEQEGVGSYEARVNDAPPPEILRAFANRFHFTAAVPERLFPAVLRGAATSDLPAPEALRSITAPALVLAWEGDAGHPLSTAELLVDLLPNASLHVATRLRDVATWTDHVNIFLAGG